MSENTHNYLASGAEITHFSFKQLCDANISDSRYGEQITRASFKSGFERPQLPDLMYKAAFCPIEHNYSHPHKPI